jgi:hypothetical protein
LTVVLRDSSATSKDNGIHGMTKRRGTMPERPLRRFWRGRFPEQRETPVVPALTPASARRAEAICRSAIDARDDGPRWKPSAGAERTSGEQCRSSSSGSKRVFRVHLHQQSYAEQPRDAYEIKGVQMVPGQGTYRTALPRAEYPDMYELHDEAARLTKAINKKQVEEAVGKAKGN